MDGASLPTLIAPQALATPETAAAGAPLGDAARAGFAAVLGATELTGLTAEQKATLDTLLVEPAKVLGSVVVEGGKDTPPAAILGLLGALGLPVEGVLAQAADGAPPGPTGDALAGDDSPALRRLLAALAAMLEPVATVQVSTVGVGSTSLAGSVAMSALLGSAPASPTASAPAVGGDCPATAAASEGEGPPRPAVPWQLLRAAQPGQDGQPPRSVAEESTLLSAAGGGTGESELGAALLAAAGQPAASGEVRDGTGVDAAAGLGALLDAEPALSGRAALAVTPELAPPRPTPPGPPVVTVPVGEPGWARGFGERVVWLVSQQLQAAEVRLNPPHLGPVEVRLSLQGQEASVSFTVAHGAVREAIEQAIPRLRDMFAEQNLQIVNVDVGQRDGSSQASQGDRSRAGGGSSGPVATAPAEAGGSDAVSPRGRHTGLPGLVDEYV